MGRWPLLLLARRRFVMMLETQPDDAVDVVGAAEAQWHDVMKLEREGDAAHRAHRRGVGVSTAARRLRHCRS